MDEDGFVNDIHVFVVYSSGAVDGARGQACLPLKSVVEQWGERGNPETGSGGVKQTTETSPAMLPSKGAPACHTAGKRSSLTEP